MPGMLLAASLLGTSLPAVAYDAERTRTELAAIIKLAQSSTPAALARLDALKAEIGVDAPYAVRQNLLRTEVWLRADAGQLETVYAVERESLKLAQANNDLPAVVVAKLGAVRELLDKNELVAAETMLTAVAREMPEQAPVEAQLSLARIEGDVFNAKAQFEKALAAYLRGLKLEQDRPGDGESRADLMVRIARVYINIDNSAKAVETVQKGLAEPGISAPTVGGLHFAMGIALVNLNRGAEGIASFEKALRIAEQGGLTALEANVRGNISDYYLRQHDYPRAEQEARLALVPSQKVADHNLVMMAKANLGFALMGQGRIAAGLPFVDGVIADLRKADSPTDVEAMMDEKSRMLERAGLFKDALVTVREQQVLSRSTSRMARDRAVAALQEQFDASERTRQIELLRRENQLQESDLRARRLVQIGTTVAAVLTVLAGFFMFVLYRRAARANARLHELNTQLEFHSMRDSLTGLHNRRSFQQKMEGRAGQGKRERRAEASEGVDCFALMDIDHFKQINDRWGHAVGDSVLVEVARRLNTAVRDTDMVLRWGGEEFMVYAPGANPAHIGEMIERILNAIGSTPVDAGTATVPVTMTAGVIWLPFGASEDSELDWHRGVRLADWALYYGKAHGRNQAQIVTRLVRPIQDVLEALEGTKGGVLHDGLLELACVSGPEQKGS